ncbi:hypothetical protein J4727_08540 [Providencia rettgeri]|uniref:Uncharacterized protein n=1 Tax=Providencia rettgeri TaxID=587 RepID=A0A939NEG7_PRORE|nr:hypothetical protein [Providencia rettgeri]
MLEPNDPSTRGEIIAKITLNKCFYRSLLKIKYLNSVGYNGFDIIDINMITDVTEIEMTK